MRILEQDRNRLVIELRPTWLWVFLIGLFLLFFCLGFGMQYILPSVVKMMGLPGAAGVMPSGLGLAMGILGFASVIPLGIAVLILKTRLVTFNRAAQMITINAKGLLGRSEETYPVSAFQGASLDRSQGSDGRNTSRAVLHFSDRNGLVPLTPYSTSGPGPARTVDAINTWFGPVVQTGGQALNRSGPEASEAIAALDKLGIRIPR